MANQIADYFIRNADSYFQALGKHICLSIASLLAACLIGIPAGYLCAKHKKWNTYVQSIFQTLRIIPSLAVLILLLPLMGTGTKPAVTALVLLAVPPVLMNAKAGFEGVPESMLETARGLGMSEWMVFRKVWLPLSMPLIMTGIKTAFIEIIASATLAAYIGGGGLGDIIFTGIGLNRMELLLIGGGSVALLSITANLGMGALERAVQKYKYAGK